MNDFLVNIAAGLVVFALDVGLVLVLLPRIIERRTRASWEPTRRAMVDQLTTWIWDLRITLELLERKLKLFEQDVLEEIAQAKAGAGDWKVRQRMESELRRIADTVRESREGLATEMVVYVPCLDAELSRLVSQYMRNAAVLAGAATSLWWEVSAVRMSGVDEQRQENRRRAHTELLQALEGLNESVGRKVTIDERKLKIEGATSHPIYLERGDDGLDRLLEGVLTKVAGWWPNAGTQPAA